MTAFLGRLKILVDRAVSRGFPWNDFLLPLLVIKQGTIQLAQMQFYGQFLKEYGPLTASLVLSAIPIIVFYLALQKYIIKGIAAGAVKG